MRNINSRLRRVMLDDDRRPARQLLSSQRRIREKSTEDLRGEIWNSLESATGWCLKACRIHSENRKVLMNKSIRSYKIAKNAMSKLDEDYPHYEVLLVYMDAVRKFIDVVEKDYLKIVDRVRILNDLVNDAMNDARDSW